MTDDKSNSKVRRMRRRVPLTVALLALLAVTAAGGWWSLRPSSADAEPVPGEVVALEPIQVNLDAGGYLRVGIALQLVEGTEAVDGSKALDALIATTSGLPAGVTSSRGREQLRVALRDEVVRRYQGEVMDVYFTEFVSQ